MRNQHETQDHDEGKSVGFNLLICEIDIINVQNGKLLFILSLEKYKDRMKN